MKFKTLFAVLAALGLLLLFTPDSQAQYRYYVGPTTVLGATNVIAPLATNAVANTVIDFPLAEYITLSCTGYPLLSNSFNPVVHVLVGNGSTFGGGYGVGTAAAGPNGGALKLFLPQGKTNSTTGTTATSVTNIFVGAWPSFKVIAVGSAEDLGIISNVNLTFGYKR